MSQQLFSEINKQLIARLSEDTIYQGKEFSYFKLFQHGVVYAINRSQNKTLRHYFHLPVAMQRWIYSLKKDTAKSYEIPLKPAVWLEPARVYKVSENEVRSMYGHKLTALYGDRLSSVKIKDDPYLKCDLDFFRLPEPGGKLDAVEKKIHSDVATVARKLMRSKHYNTSEKNYILSALHVFFHAFRKYHRLLRHKGVKKLYFIAHYHNEAIAAACKIHGIECTELQHGLINTHDLYYAYDPVFGKAVQNAMFPDKILLYGPYWKRVLEKGCEWKRDQLIIAGDYLAPDFAEPDLSKKENLILVASQKGMDDQYVPFILQLREKIKKHSDWRVIVKLHPMERNAEAYRGLENDQVKIAGRSDNIFSLLERARIQISIYSTTFFDAAGYRVMNFSWKSGSVGSDYASALVNEGVAFAIDPADDPVEYYGNEADGYAFLSRDDVYAPFNPGMMIR